MAAQFFGYIGSRCLSTRQTNQTVDLFVGPLFWPVHCYPANRSLKPCGVTGAATGRGTNPLCASMYAARAFVQRSQHFGEALQLFDHG